MKSLSTYDFYISIQYFIQKSKNKNLINMLWLYFVFKYNKLVVLKLQFTTLMLVVSGGSIASTGVSNLDTLSEIFCKKKGIHKEIW